MFKLFKKQTAVNPTVEAAVVEPKVNLKGKTTNQLVEEIHETFYTEVDRLLAGALQVKSLDTDKGELIEKCKRLKALGFSNTKEVKEAEIEIKRLDNLGKENELNKELTEAINYFSFKYPNYKFITEDSVKAICQKYNLIYGEIANYIGSVPDKNLKQMEEFAISEKDECGFSKMVSTRFWGSELNNGYDSFESIKIKKEEDLKMRDRVDYLAAGFREVYGKCPLEIAAPIKDFNMDGMEVKNHKISKIEIPDPIVLKPVIYKGKKHYLIVTAWGLEASDEIVVNQKMN
jgi:hypothetical protein